MEWQESEELKRPVSCGDHQGSSENDLVPFKSNIPDNKKKPPPTWINGVKGVITHRLRIKPPT